MKTQSSETSSEIETPPLSPSYQEIRAAGKDLFAKIMEATRHLDFDMVKAARKMTLPTEERTFIFDSSRYADMLVAGYHQRMKTVLPADRAERRFVFFYQMHQKYGQPQAYQDVGSKK